MFFLDYRRALCKRFPYKVVYQILEAEQAIHVVAVTHAAEDPDAWKMRIDG